MNILILYSSVTGNTEYLAKSLKSSEHVLTVLPVYPFPKNLDYDIIFLGFWVYRGAPDPRMIRVMQKLKRKNIALFGTLSAYPHSEHAQKNAFSKNIPIKKTATNFKHFLIQSSISKTKNKLSFFWRLFGFSCYFIKRNFINSCSL